MEKILETERLILRVWTSEDAPALYEICRDAAVMRHIGTCEPYRSIDEARAFLDWAVAYQTENGFCRWAVVSKQTGKIVGSCGFARRKHKDVELGYLFARDVWGNGSPRKRRERVSNTASRCSDSRESSRSLTLIISLRKKFWKKSDFDGAALKNMKTAKIWFLKS